jgi:hypothetical protein
VNYRLRFFFTEVAIEAGFFWTFEPNAES